MGFFIIVWRGLGLPIIFVGAAVMALVGSISANPDNHFWVSLLTCTAGGGTVYFLDWLRRRETGVSRDSLYYIPIRVWAFIIVIGGVCYAFVPIDSLRRPGDATDAQAASGQSTDTVVVQARPAPEPIPAISQPVVVHAPPPPKPISWNSQPDVIPARPAPEPISSTSHLKLQAVFYTGSKTSTAIINDKTVSVGDKQGDLTVMAIDPQSVKLRTADGKALLLRLSKTSR